MNYFKKAITYSLGLVLALGFILTPIQNAFAQQSTSSPSETTSEQDFPLEIPTAEGPDVVECFDHYKFGGVVAEINPMVSTAVSGTPISFNGTIKNENPYPVIDIKVVAKVFRLSQGGKNINAPDVVDEFTIVDHVTIPASSTFPFTTSWNIPRGAESGTYRIATFVVASNKFNLSGLTFTDDIIGYSAEFGVEGSEGAVRFDKSEVYIDGQKFYFAAFPPHVDKQKPIIVKAKIENTLSVPADITVDWTAYLWDAQHPDNVRATSSPKRYTIPAKSSMDVQYEVKSTRVPVYYVVGRLQYKDTKSIIGTRFVREEVQQYRLNFPAVTQYPLVKGQSTGVFSCLHAVSDLADLKDDGKLILRLKDSSGKEFFTHTYTGMVTSQMMAIKKDFVPEKDYTDFTLYAELYRGADMVEKVKIKYNCKDLLDESQCGMESSKIIFIGGGVLALIIIGLVLVRRRHKIKSAVLPVIFTLAILAGFLPSSADAKETVWNFTWANTTLFVRDKGDGVNKTAFYNPNFTIKYKTEVTRESGEVLNGGESLPVGTRLNVRFVPHISEHIYWFSTGSSWDSPYGEWGNADVPPPVTCLEKDFVFVRNVRGIKPNLSFRDKHYASLIVNPPSKALSGLSNLSCSAVGTSGTATCTVTGTGPVNISTDFGATTGKFYYRRFLQLARNAWSGRVDDDPGRCYAPNPDVPMIDRATGLSRVLQVPAQSVSFAFNAEEGSQPPSNPTVSGPTTGAVGQTYTFGAVSTDADGDQVKYGIGWNGREEVNTWAPSTGFVNQGTNQSFTKSWSAPGTYTFKVMAQDDSGLTSPGWVEHTIVIEPEEGIVDGCVPGSPDCNSSCGTISSVASGQTLLSTNPGLCKSGLTYLTDSFDLNTDISQWSWSCQGDWQAYSERCTSSCVAGTNYCPTTGTCESSCDYCANIDGVQVDRSIYDVDEFGNCTINADFSIDYFRLAPDTAETQCPAYWEITGPDTLDIRCTIGGSPVPRRNPFGGLGSSQLVPVGRNHTLVCKAYSGEGAVLKTVDASARCYRIGEIVED